MSDESPFRSELDAAHRRIETLEAEHATKVDALQRENARLRERLIDVTPSRNATGRIFGALGMIILGVSLAVGIFVARVTRAPSAILEKDVVRIALRIRFRRRRSPSSCPRRIPATSIAATWPWCSTGFISRTA